MFLGKAARKAAREQARRETGYDPQAKSSVQALTSFSFLWFFGGVIVTILGATVESDAATFTGSACTLIGFGLLYLSSLIRQKREPLYLLYIQSVRRHLQPWRRHQLRLAAALFAVAMALGVLGAFVHSTPALLAREQVIFYASAIVTPIIILIVWARSKSLSSSDARETEV